MIDEAYEETAEALADRTRARIAPSTKAIPSLRFKFMMHLGIAILPAWELQRGPEGLSRPCLRQPTLARSRTWRKRLRRRDLGLSGRD